MTISTNWSYPTNTRFGPGRIQELGEACLALDIKNPLLVTDKGLASLDITENAVKILKSSGFQGRVLVMLIPIQVN